MTSSNKPPTSSASKSSSGSNKDDNSSQSVKDQSSVKNGNKTTKDTHKSQHSHKSSQRTSQSKRSGNPKKGAKDDSWFQRISGITNSAFKIAKKTTDGSLRVGKTILKSQDQLKVMVAAGQSLKDLREVAGLTIHDLTEATNLKDKTFWEAVEDGTATISFELILRLAALLARNDPVPFILKYTRTYNPELWRMLNDWGLGRLPLQYEREREFINIYRRHDAARQLSDEGFERVLQFTRNAFEMALHFIGETENLKVVPSGDNKDEGKKDEGKKETKEKATEVTSEYPPGTGSKGKPETGSTAEKTETR